MRIEIAGCSETGTVRARNEDALLLGHEGVLETASTAFRTFGLLVAVADGMGGYAGGEIASTTALEALRTCFYGEPRDANPAAQLAGYLARVQEVVAARLRQEPGLEEAGTTIAGIALLPPDVLLVFHAGDSRVLRASGGFVRQLTVDHTPLGDDLASGRLSEAEAAATGMANRLTRALGLTGDARVELDTSWTWAAGDTFLLGTDGWHGVGHGLTREALRDLVREGGDAAHLARASVARAVAADGSDNATAAVVRILDEGGTP
jgi:protein phosphatase